MPMPQPTTVAQTTSPAPVADNSTPVVATTPGKAVIKQFGIGFDETTGADGAKIKVKRATPQPSGVDLLAFGKELFASIEAKAKSVNVSTDAFLATMVLDKPNVPGHKEGRATYNIANAISMLGRVHANLTKERGVGGSKTKAALDAMTDKVSKLRAKLVAMGLSEDEITDLAK